MMKCKLILTSLIVLGCSLALTGCNDGAKEKAELAKVKATLEEAELELANVTQARDKLQEQVNELIKSRDAAVIEAKNAKARIDKLTSQLQEQMKKIDKIQEQIKKVQMTIEELQKKPVG